MEKLFVPYAADNTPAAIEINGHRVLIVSTDPGEMKEELAIVGGTEVREFEYHDNEPQALADLAASIKGGVVLAPPGVSVSAMITSLSAQLPWIH